MKIAFCLFKYYPYGGLERDFLRIASGFLAKGHEIHVFTMNWQGTIPEGFHIHYIPKQGFSNHFRALNFAKAINQTHKKLKYQQFDCMIGFNRIPGLDFYFAGDLCFAKTAQAKHRPWYRYTPRYRIYQKLEQAVFAPEAKTKIITLTNPVKQSYQDFYGTPDKRFYLIPAGIERLNLTITARQSNYEGKREQLAIPKNHKLLLQVGSDFNRKGLDRSLHAIAALPIEQQQKLHFYIIGKGKTKIYETLINKLGIKANIVFFGVRDDVQALMQAADALLHPAYFETAGMVLIEALSCGLPIIVTDNCGYAFHVAKANAGILLTTPFQQQQFNEKLQLLLAVGNKQYKQWQHNALSYAEHTNLYSMVDKVVELVETELASIPTL